jgi:hypothetical protein
MLLYTACALTPNIAMYALLPYADYTVLPNTCICIQTLAIFAALTIFTFQTKIDFSFLGAGTYSTTTVISSTYLTV